MSFITLKIQLPDGPIRPVEIDDRDTVEDLIDELAFAGHIRGIGQDYNLEEQSKGVIAHDQTLVAAGLNSSSILILTKKKEVHKGISTPQEEEQYKRDTVKTEDEVETMEPVTEPMSFHQLGILLLDGSGSMGRKGNEGKALAQQVDEAVSDFLKHFSRSTIAQNFSIAIISFDHDARVLMPSTKLPEIDLTQSFNPLQSHGGGTDIGNALHEAQKIAFEHINNDQDRGMRKDVVMVVMSDGSCQNAEQTKLKAKAILENDNIEIATTLFSNKKIKESEKAAPAILLLRSISSKDSLFRQTFSKDELRKFFTSSLSIRKGKG